MTREDLASIHGLILDATRDTILWLQADPLEEEKAHVLGIQQRLGELDRIIGRQNIPRLGDRLERRRMFAQDRRDWSRTVAEVPSLLDKARAVRGNMVGNVLARLADRLPRELPGSKPRKPRTKLPEPVRPSSTVLTSVHITKALDPPAPATYLGGGGMGYSTPKASQVPHDPPRYFPSDLWPQTIVILLKAQRMFPLQAQTLDLCKHIILQMTPLLCEAVNAGKMKADAVQREKGGGMEDLLHFLLVHNDPGPSTGWGISNAAYQLGKEVRQSGEWLRLAEAIAEAQRHSTGADRLVTNGKQAESSRVQNNEKTAQSEKNKSMDRRAMVRAYIEEVRIKTGKRITKKDIWSKVGYQTRTEFERWERHDLKHPNRAADEIFTRTVCDEKPHLK